MAYFKGNDGRLAPVRDTTITGKDKDWIGLRFTDYDGPRIRLGVLKIINKSATSEEMGNAEKIEVPVAGIQEILTVALGKTNRFDVIEQKRIKEIQSQQTRKDVYEPSPAVIINEGKVLASQYLVYGTVNEWSPDRSNGTLQRLSRLKVGRKDSEVAITFSLADVASGQVLFSTAERARLAEWSLDLGEPNRGGGTLSQRTPVSYAVHACANKAAFKIAMFLRNRKWKGTVVDIKKADYFINAGSQQGMSAETKLSVQSVLGVVRDTSGTILGENLRGIGTLKVITVQNGFSVARLEEGGKGIKKGDRVELATNPVPPKKIPACENLDTSEDP
jgi:curli biogenesis system outer membrane secretion channel CsgG